MKGKTMCVERIQRLMMAAFLVVIFYCVSAGLTTVSLVLIAFMFVMLVVWAIADFCPSIWMLRKFLPSCKKGSE